MTIALVTEADRLRHLKHMRLAEPATLPGLDQSCNFARQLFRVPVALVTVVDEAVTWIKGVSGSQPTEMPRELAFCSHAIGDDRPLVVSDLTREPRFAGNPLVTGEPRYRFYAGVPLALEPGLHIGTLCILDYVPRALDEHQIGLLKGLAELTLSELRLHRANFALEKGEERFRALVETSHSILWRSAPNGDALEVSLAGAFAGHDPGDLMGESWADTIHPDDRDRGKAAWAHAVATGTPLDVMERKRACDGTYRWVRVRAVPLRNTDGSIREWVGATADIHEQRVAELNVREREERVQLALKAGRMVAWEKDLRTGAITRSDSSVELLGFQSGHASDVLERLAPDDRDRVTAATNGETAETVEFRYERPDGEVLWFAARGMQVTEDRHGKRLVGITFDITKRRRAEAKLQASERRHRALIQASSAIIWRADPAGSILETWGWNDSTGQDREESMGGGWLEAVHPDDRREVAAQWHDTVTMGQPKPVTFRIRQRDGSYRWVQSRTVAIRDASGEVDEWVGTLTDITEKKIADEAILQSKALYRLLAEHTTDMVVKADLTGRHVYVSPASHDLLSYGPEELVGIRPQDRAHPDDAGRVARLIREIGEGRVERAASTYRLARKDGTWVWVEATYRLVRDANDAPAEIVSATRDISDRQRQTEELRAAKILAEQASQAKSDFLATMSHEIRTPLNGVLGYADLLLNDDALAQEQRRYVERIQTAGTALLTVVNDVLDFSRIEAGQIELEPVAFSPGVLLQNAVSIVKPLADERGLALDVAIDPVLPEHLVGDQDRLQQVLLNLLNNAIKFTPDGRIDLTISVENCTPRECTLRAEVADTGIGIAQDKQGRLFQQFSQVDGSIRRQYGGTGLGLAISRRLVELMGGRIGVTSALGQGARFWFSVTLPRAEQSQADPAPTQPSRGPGRSARILLVEDNEINQEIARTLLGAAGHQVDLAPDGAVAIKSVQSHAYDLVLMDVQMPVMDGITAAKHIRMLEGGERYLPIIALTANVLPQQVRAFTEAGMDDHIAKPFRKETLLACVDRWLVADRSSPDGVPLRRGLPSSIPGEPQVR